MKYAYLGNKEPHSGLLDELLNPSPKLISVDIETVSLENRVPLGLAIATSPTDSFYFPMLPSISPVFPWQALRDPSVAKIFHNSIFDLGVMRNMNYSIDETNIEDTYVMAQLLNLPTRLANMAAFITNWEITPASELLARESATTMLELSDEVVARHCCIDAMATYAAYEKYSSEVDKEYYRVEVNLIPLLLRMSGCGLRIDHEVRELIELSLESDVKLYRDTAEGLGFNPASPKQVAYMLAKRGNFLPMTKSKKSLSSNATTIRKLADPLAELVLKFREESYLLTHYIKPWSEAERAYTRFHLDAITSRISSTDRNMQNIPKGAIRNIFIPDNDYWTDLDFCVAPETPILTTNLTWIAAEDLSVGEELIAIEEEGLGHRRRMIPTKIDKITSVHTEAYSIRFSNGKHLISSGEHRWLQAGAYWRSPWNWIPTKSLKVGDRIRYFGDVWDTETSYEGGYLAGFLDGEGYVSKAMIGFAQKPGALFDSVSEMLESREFLGTTKYIHKYKGADYELKQFRVTDMYSALRLLGSIRPQRLLPKANILWMGREPPRIEPSAEIVSIEGMSIMELVGIQTDKHTFIANGFFSHNSQIELRVFAYLTQDKKMLYTFESGGDIHQSTADFCSIHRNTAKNVNFSIIYGATVDTVAETAGVSNDVAGQLLHRWFMEYAEAGDWVVQQQKEALRAGEVTTLYGRTIKLPMEESESRLKRKAVNYPVQASASEIVKRAMLRCSHLPLYLQVHDELLFDGVVVLPDGLDWIHPQLHTPYTVKTLMRWE